MPSTWELIAVSFSVACILSALDTVRRVRNGSLLRKPALAEEQFVINGVAIRVGPDDTLSPLASFLLETACLGTLLLAAIIATLNVASLFTDAVESRFVFDLFPALTYHSWCCCAGLIYIGARNVAHTTRAIWRDGFVAAEHDPRQMLFWRGAARRALLKGTILFALYLVVVQPVQTLAAAILLYGYLAEGHFQLAPVHARAVGLWMVESLVEP